MHNHKASSLEDCVVGLLALGRLISEIVGSVPTGVDLRGARFDRFFADLAEGNVLVPAHAGILDEICDAVLAYFECECPGHVETMFRGSIHSFPLNNAELAAARSLWDAVRKFRLDRQNLYDQVRAMKIAADVLRRPHL